MHVEIHQSQIWSCEYLVFCQWPQVHLTNFWYICAQMSVLYADVWLMLECHALVKQPESIILCRFFLDNTFSQFYVTVLFVHEYFEHFRKLFLCVLTQGFGFYGETGNFFCYHPLMDLSYHHPTGKCADRKIYSNQWKKMSEGPLDTDSLFFPKGYLVHYDKCLNMSTCTIHI